MQKKLIKEAVKKLKRFGFTYVMEENISIDEVYKFYFKKILLQNLGKNKETDKAIHELLEKLQKLPEKAQN